MSARLAMKRVRPKRQAQRAEPHENALARFTEARIFSNITTTMAHT